MNQKNIRTAALLLFLAGCGSFGGNGYMEEARRAASKPGLSPAERADVYEQAGDRAATSIRRGYALELYFAAADALNTPNSPEARAGIQRIYQKCLDKGLNQNFVGLSVSCDDIRELSPGNTSTTIASNPYRADAGGAGTSSYPMPSSANAPSPACTTGQREVVDAQATCARGNTAMCSRVDALKNALRSLGCAIPVLGSRSSSEPEPRSAPGDPQQRPQKAPVDCVRQQRNASGTLDLLNGCGYTVSYSFCLQGGDPSGAFACDASMNGRGTDFIKTGGSSFGYRAQHIVFVACKGGAADGHIASLEAGRGYCR